MSTISQVVEDHRPDVEPLIEVYKQLHRNPELSNQERETSALVLEQLRSVPVDLEIKKNIGGYGIAAVLRNGSGPTVLLRADFDALPVQERTGLDYASTKRMKDADGNEVDVAHACGHDMHATCLLGAAHLLASSKDRWSGTVVLVFQPAEELGTGAQGMIDDGLYEKHNIPIPDVALAGHVLPLRVGVVGTKKGLIASSADSMHITIYGKGAHASMPDKTIDPIVIAASTIMRLQTIVSREMDPHDSNVVSVTSIHAGHSDNVISDEATLSLDIRNVSQQSRDRVIEKIKRIVRFESLAGGAPKEPKIVFTRQYPATHNHADVSERISKSFSAHFGEGEHAFHPDCAPCGASEDFSHFASAVDRPYCFWTYGGVDEKQWDDAEEKGRLGEDIPANHSPEFAPVIMPTLQIGLDAYAIAALTYLTKD